MKSGFEIFRDNLKLELLKEWSSVKTNPKSFYMFILFLIIYTFLIIFFPMLAIAYIVILVVAILSALLFYDIDYFYSDYRKQSKKSIFDITLTSADALEYEVWKILNSQNLYKKLLANCYIPKGNNTFSQIDLIMICKFGIYVFECKARQGVILNGYNKRNLMQKIGNYYNFFYNPIMQNYYHIKYLNEDLNLNSNIYKSFVIFGNNANVTHLNVPSKNTFILNRKNLNSILNKQYINSKETLSKKEIDDIYKQLSHYTAVSQKTKNKHINDVKNLKGKN